MEISNQNWVTFSSRGSHRLFKAFRGTIDIKELYFFKFFKVVFVSVIKIFLLGKGFYTREKFCNKISFKNRYI